MKLLTIAVMLVPSLALAQVKQVPQKVQHVEFGDDVQSTGVERPSDSYLMAPPHAKFDCLIRLRANFRGELQRA